MSGVVAGRQGAAAVLSARPGPFASNWDARWQRALDDWMAVENLEERAAAPGWIDRRVLEGAAGQAARLSPADRASRRWPRGCPIRAAAVCHNRAMERLSRVIGPIATNVHILADPRSREAIAIDTATRPWPGSPTSWPSATGRSS